MNWFNLLSLLTATTDAAQVSNISNEQFIFLVLGGLFLIVIFAVVVVCASTSAASAAVAVDDEDSADM